MNHSKGKKWDRPDAGHHLIAIVSQSVVHETNECTRDTGTGAI